MVSPSRPTDMAGGPGGPVGAAARGALALIAAGALIGLTACGGTVAGDADAPGLGGHRRLHGPGVGGRRRLRGPIRRGDGVGRGPALCGRREGGPGGGHPAGQSRPRSPPGRDHDQGRRAGSRPGRRALRASAHATRAALRGRHPRGVPADVRGRESRLPARRRPAVRLPQRHRARAGPIVVRVPAVRAAADQDGRRRWPAGPGHAPEQRADALTGSPVRRQSIQSFYTAGHC